eukprot:scaffold49972_cov23-Cyclotella_meneghiniana.AAC.1
MPQQSLWCDGVGSYFDLHTGSHGFGMKVDHDTMATYLKRFGVSEEKISELPLTLKGVEPNLDLARIAKNARSLSHNAVRNVRRKTGGFTNYSVDCANKK